MKKMQQKRYVEGSKNMSQIQKICQKHQAPLQRYSNNLGGIYIPYLLGTVVYVHMIVYSQTILHPKLSFKEGCCIQANMYALITFSRLLFVLQTKLVDFSEIKVTFLTIWPRSFMIAYTIGYRNVQNIQLIQVILEKFRAMS